jgi:hypothetical protein
MAVMMRDVRSVWMYGAYAVVIAAVGSGACGKSSSTATGGGSGNGNGNGNGSGSGSGGGSGGGVRTAMSNEIEAVVADTLQDAERMLPVLASFDGDCDAYADKLLTLEPLVTSIRGHYARMQRDPSAALLAKQLLAAHKTDELARLDQAVAALGTTRAALDQKDADVKRQCADNAHVQAAMAKVGLYKKDKP